MIGIEGEAGYLTGNILHLNYETINQFLEKMIKLYTSSEADSMISNGYKFSPLDIVKKPISEFLSRFFYLHGYKDGLHGLFLSFLQAFYHLVVVARVWEKQGFEATGDSLSLFEKSAKESGKELKFWIYEEKRKREKNKIKKVFWSIKKKSPL